MEDCWQNATGCFFKPRSILREKENLIFLKCTKTNRLVIHSVTMGHKRGGSHAPFGDTVGCRGALKGRS